MNKDDTPVPGYTPDTLRVQSELKTAEGLATFERDPFTIEIAASSESVWVIVRRPRRGGVALRAVPPAGPLTIEQSELNANGGAFQVRNVFGHWTVAVSVRDSRLVHVEATLSPLEDLLVPYWPRDLYPLDVEDDPRGAVGNVEAAQRGLNLAVCYFCLSDPRFGNVLYLQDLTRLNPFFHAVEGVPDAAVGGQWPELGYLPPTTKVLPSPQKSPLKRGTQVVTSDAYLALDEDCAVDEQASADSFLRLLASIYPHLEKTPPARHDWVERAERTLRDLATASTARVEHYGHVYLHPYTSAEYPDSMVQMAVARPLFEYARCTQQDIPLVDALFGGMDAFYDSELQALRRYLPNVGGDKNRNAVDSWYLYHPLLNLGRMALAGHEGAVGLFKRSLPYAIKAAHHFKYSWPIQFDATDFSVLVLARDDRGFGQTDVGGVYAYVMLQAFELTGEVQYLNEAKTALRVLEGLRFDLLYQTNLTAWGATACAKLYQIEQNLRWVSQGQVFIAGFFHNCELWNSELGHAKHFVNFLGATCLHDAPYMAAYECFESFGAFQEYLQLLGDTAPASTRLLLEQFCAYGLDRGWYFFPDALPEEAVASKDIRNGYIDRDLSFPLEDLYGDGRLAGQVGQEIYGCGGVFVFATHVLAHDKSPAALQNAHR